MDEAQRPQHEIRGEPQPGDLPSFLTLLAGIVARRLKEEAQKAQQEQPPNVVVLPRQRRKRSAS